MELKGIKKVSEGHFINRYDLTYETVDKQIKVYEIISRDKELNSEEELNSDKVDSVVLIMHSEDGEKLLLNKEYRLAAADWVYNFPAGLIDPGEKPEEAAKRELFEETGLELVKITDTLGISYSAIGFSNEKNLTYIGVAKGEIRPSDSTLEEIEAIWLSKEELRKLLKTCRFAGRTQSYCYLWSRE